MPTPEVERALAEGAERSRAASSPAPAGATPPRRGELARACGTYVGAWYASLPPQRRKLLIGIGLFLLFDLIAGLAAVTMGTHF